MVETIEVFQNEDKEALEFTYTNENDGSDIDISGGNTTVIEFRAFVQGASSPLFTASLSNGKIVKTGTNTCEYRPGSTDYSTIGLYCTELLTTFSDGRVDRNQNLLLKIRPKAPVGA